MSTYVTIEQFREYCKTNSPTDVANTAMLQAALDAAEASINDLCQRQFVVAGVTPTVREFPPSGDGCVRIHDCTTITAVSLNGFSIDLTTVQKRPLNGVSRTGVVVPFEELYRPYLGWYQLLPLATVAVTATWGWAAIPAPVVEACKILAKDILTNRDVMFGIVGTEAFAMRASQNPQVTGRIGPYRRVESFGIA